MSNHKRTGVFVALTTLLWMIAVGFGLGMIWNYENSQEAEQAAPLRWPAESLTNLVSNRPTLVMVVHPQCPCTRASIGELALLMARAQGLVSANVLFFKPAGFPEGWEKTDLWSSAENIPGVTVVCDEGGIEARRFNQKTSGAVVLYDPNGRLLFTGGITGSRGHSGENDGRTAIVALLIGEVAKRTQTPVFGCSLVDEYDLCSEGEDLCSRRGQPWTDTDQ